MAVKVLLLQSPTDTPKVCLWGTSLIYLQWVKNAAFKTFLPHLQCLKEYSADF